MATARQAQRTKIAREALVISGIAALSPPPATKGPTALVPVQWAGAPARLQRMDRLCALALVACDAALLDAAIDPRTPVFAGDDSGVIFGTAYGCHATNEDYYRSYLDAGLQSASPRLFAYTLPSSPVGEISIHYGIKGPATALAQGATAGLDAVLDGMRQIERGRAGRALVVAADVATPLLGRLLEEEGASGELADSAAALVLEPADVARARDRAPRGRIVAITSCFDAGQRAAAIQSGVRQTLAAAGIALDAIDSLWGPAVDCAAIGLDRPARDVAPEALAAAPLHNMAHFLTHGTGRALVVIGDPEGTACVALVERA